MKSMTGYGRGSANTAFGTVNLEIKAVNSRYLELNIRNFTLPQTVEEQIRTILRQNISRGKVDVTVSIKATEKESYKKVSIDYGLLDSYINALKWASREYYLKEIDLHLSHLLQVPEPWLIVEENIESDEELIKGVKEAIENALHEFNAMKEREGNNLKVDLLNRMNFLKEKLNFLISRQDVAAKEYENRLKSRIQKFLNDSGVEMKEERILEEVAIFSEKSDYTEEVVRFKSHLDQFSSILGENGAIGRKLDFLMQELNREVNTIGSKASDTQVVDCVIIMKTELEKIREQVQNIE